MELEDFISETLRQIIDGVKGAQEHAKEQGAKVNPIYVQTGHSTYAVEVSTQAPIQFVDFDVAVTETKGKEAKGGIGVFFGGVGIGAKGTSDASNQSTNRIRFTIPVSLPRDEGDKAE